MDGLLQLTGPSDTSDVLREGPQSELPVAENLRGLNTALAENRTGRLGRRTGRLGRRTGRLGRCDRVSWIHF